MYPPGRVGSDVVRGALLSPPFTSVSPSSNDIVCGKAKRFLRGNENRGVPTPKLPTPSAGNLKLPAPGPNARFGVLKRAWLPRGSHGNCAHDPPQPQQVAKGKEFCVVDKGGVRFLL